MKKLVIAAVGAAFVATGSAGAYEVVSVSNGGTIKGTVKYEGTAPKRGVIEITKDGRVCGKEGPTKLAEELVVGAGGGLQNAVVRLTDITKGAAFPETKATLDQRVCQFRPHVVTVPVGQPLSVLNSDGILHNVHTYPDANAPVNKAQPGFKKQIQLTFDKPEFGIRVECDAHGWMKGWIIVQDHPYYAVTDENGSFSLANVPPGDYTVEVWQETLGKKTASVSVPGGGEATVNVSFAAK